MPFDGLIEKSFSAWIPNGQKDGPTPLGTQGLSGAMLYKVKIKDPGRGGDVSVGTYILKIAQQKEGREDESEAFKKAKKFAKDNGQGNFFKCYVPDLKKTYRDGENQYSCILMQAVSQDNFKSADSKEDKLLKLYIKSITVKSLKCFSSSRLENSRPPHQLLEDWLGPRLDSQLESGARLEDCVQWATQKNRRFFYGDNVLVNPLWFYKFLKEKKERCFNISPLNGLLHRDFHGGNILIPNDANDNRFSIIDFAMARSGHIGYDQAYLEVFLCLNNLEGEGFPDKILMRILDALENSKLEDLACKREKAFLASISSRGEYLFKILKEIRMGWKIWKNIKFGLHPPDDLERQHLLSRVAAGLNWASKKLNGEDDKNYQCKLALGYAGFAAKRYLEKREKELHEEFDRIPHEVDGFFNDFAQRVLTLNFKSEREIFNHLLENNHRAAFLLWEPAPGGCYWLTKLLKDNIQPSGNKNIFIVSGDSPDYPTSAAGLWNRLSFGLLRNANTTYDEKVIAKVNEKLGKEPIILIADDIELLSSSMLEEIFNNFWNPLVGGVGNTTSFHLVLMMIDRSPRGKRRQADEWGISLTTGGATITTIRPEVPVRLSPDGMLSKKEMASWEEAHYSALCQQLSPTAPSDRLSSSFPVRGKRPVEEILKELLQRFSSMNSEFLEFFSEENKDCLWTTL